MKRSISVFLILFSTQVCLAGFGGSRSSGSSFSGGSRSSFSSGSRSSFGGSRSSGVSSFSSRPTAPVMRSNTFGGSRASGQPATITKPAAPQAAPVYVPPPVIHRETVIHQSSGSGFGTGFLGGMVAGSLLNNHPAPVVVAPGAGVVTEGSVMAPVVYQGHGFLYYFVCTVFTALIIGFIFIIFKGLV